MISANVMVLCPVRPGLNPVLLDNQKQLIQQAVVYAGKRGIRIHVMFDDWEPAWKKPISCHVDRTTLVSAVRNRMILLTFGATEKYAILADLTHVIWMDADIVRYEPDLFERLVETSIKYNAVTAPCIFLDDSNGKVPARRWYDTAGFIDNNQRAVIYHPWFAGVKPAEGLPWPQQAFVPYGTEYEVDGSVGCVYCVPWEVYTDGASHHFVNPTVTEHYPVCQHARTMGKKLLVCLELEVYHAYLPDYGEAFH